MLRASAIARSKPREDRLGLMEAFVAVAEKQSFAAAAVLLRTSTASVSRKVARLEKELGVQLFMRTTRRVQTTEIGEIYLGECVSILAALSRVDNRIATYSSEIIGSLNISMPVFFGLRYVFPAITEFLALNPGVSINACLSDDLVDLVEGRFDLAIRIAELQDSQMKARKIAENRRVVVASPRYLAEQGVPSKPEDLKKHRCIAYTKYMTSSDIWHFEKHGQHVHVGIDGRFRGDNSEIVYKAAIAGLGIAIVPMYICDESIASGTLSLLLHEWRTLPHSGIYVVLNKSAFVSPKVRMFTDFISGVIRRQNPGGSNAGRTAAEC